MTRRRLVLFALAVYAVALLGIITLANLGGTNEVFGFITHLPHGDKVGHFILIGTLALLSDIAASQHDLQRGRFRFPSAPLIVAALVFAEELSQLALATRSFDLGDLAADIAGIIVFVAAGRVFGSR